MNHDKKPTPYLRPRLRDPSSLGITSPTMELLRPEHPPHHVPSWIPLSGFSSPPSFSRSVSSHLPEIAEDGSNNEEKVYVALGKSVEKAVSLLQWGLRHFAGREICILHVHQPSSLIPTLLGKLPVSQANSEVVSAYRRQEKEQTVKLLQNYLSICARRKVRASVLTCECDQVEKGIVELVNRHGIKRLVMGALPENCMKVKRGSSKANYAAMYAPTYCEIWFVNKGKLVWTRESFDDPTFMPSFSQVETETVGTSESGSLQHGQSCLLLHPENFHSTSAGTLGARITDGTQDEQANMEVPLSPTFFSSGSRRISLSHQSLFDPESSSKDFAERKGSSDYDSKVEEDCLCTLLREARLEAEASSNEAFSKLLKGKKLESEAIAVISKVKLFESTYAREVKLRKEAEDALRTTIQEREKLLEEQEGVTREIQKTMRNVALLDSRAKEANRRCDEVAGELKLIQTSIVTLQQEKQRIRQQKLEAVRWLERWRSHGQAGAAKCNKFVGFLEGLPEFAEFSLAELQTASCNFSESFKLGHGGYGCVYKGEMLGRTVAIKKLHAHNVQGQSEFQREVQVLCKLQHPHLVTLLGACPEAWSLVYEYLPNGSLENRLFQKSNVSPLTWKIRARIVAEISSALCFLHSSKPEKIVHGNLKPENILLDSELSCKICDFGICRLVTEDTLSWPSFHRGTEPKGAFPYTDPEFQRIGVLTPKSDIYSFGVIILQLLTGRPAAGLVGDVRKAVSSGNLLTILDTSAGEWPMSVAMRLVDLGLQFCELSSRDRPDLTPTLVRELGQLHVPEERPVPSFFLCPILQEIMHDPQVAADGFTYEGEALRSWLENGRETSPMTNLKLSHLHLTPNHALRLAIQDWLCRS